MSDDHLPPEIRRILGRGGREPEQEVDYTGLSEAHVHEVAGGLAFIVLKTPGQPDQVFGEHAPQPAEDVSKWAAIWNRAAEALWPMEWISPTPAAPISASAMIAEAKLYGPTLKVMIQVGAKWRIYSPSKDKLLGELAKLSPHDLAEIPVGNGFRYRCFGSTLGTFGPADGGLFEIVASAEYASIALYGETIDPA